MRRQCRPPVTRTAARVRVRFTASLVPVLTCTPDGHDAALRGAAEALARLGRADLGGTVEIRRPGRPGAEHRAAGRAVEHALHLSAHSEDLR